MIGHKADLRTFKSIAKKMKNQRGDSRIFHNLNQIKSLTRAKNNLDLTSVKSSIVYKSGVLVIPYALFEILDGIKVNHIGDVRWIKCLEELADSIKTPAKDALKVAFKAWKVDLLNDFDDSDEIWIAQVKMVFIFLCRLNFYLSSLKCNFCETALRVVPIKWSFN